MDQWKSHQSVVACFNAAIDSEHANNNIEAYQKYAEGLSAIGAMLRSDVQLLHQPHVSSRHKQMVEFAKRSTDRLLALLETFRNDDVDSDSGDHDSTNNSRSATTYQQLSQTLPGIVTETPRVPVNIPDEIPGIYSPLSSIEEDNKRLKRMYENRLTSLMNPAIKADLKLELERRLAENNALARKRFEEWERRRKILADECQRIAEEKFYIREKIDSGTVSESDFTKQTLYAACLQFHKEHTWAQEYSCKLVENIADENNIKKILNFFLQNESHPLAFMLRKMQEKAINKLSKVHPNQTFHRDNEKDVLDHHFKNIARDTKEDLFVLTTVMQALWEPLNNETGLLLIIDVLHHLYFLATKPYFIQLLRIILNGEEREIAKCMRCCYSQNTVPYSAEFNSVIVKLHQLTAMHSPSTMMLFLVEILRSLISTDDVQSSDDDVKSLSVGVDSLMPKLIELILLANVSTLTAEISFVENFMPARKALGEEGYAVTLFQSVLSYIFVNSNSLEIEMNHKWN